VRAHRLRQLGRRTAALDACDRAIALTPDDAIRQFLLHRRGQEVAAVGLSLRAH
jgi:predicted RNA polymerase sigma factor